MYPFHSSQPYLRQQWIAAAWSDEVGRTPLDRTLLDEPVLLFRTEAGAPAALHGLCPHRMLPLSRGTLHGDEIACGYHGFTFDAEGRCTRIPTQAQPPANYRTRTFPARELGGVVWLWMGDVERGARTPLPDIASMGMGAAGWVSSGQHRFSLKARWSLLVDNLFDLSHIGWVHANSIGMFDTATLVPVVEDEGCRFAVRRVQRQVPRQYLPGLYPQATGRVDVDLYSDLVSPYLINAGSQFKASDTGEVIGNVNFLHLLTPETANSTHYFGLVTRDYQVDDAALSEALGRQNNLVRAEDVSTLEAIEPLADRFGDTRRELSAQVDAGAIRLRRKLEAMLQAESAG